MVDLDGPSLAEIVALAETATGPGLTEPQRLRWQELTAGVLALLSNISPTGSQRRRHVRAAANLAVEILAPVERRRLVTSSIGGGGLSLPIDPPPPLGSTLRVAIHVAERPEPVIADAQVVWHRNAPHEVGAAFTDIAPRDRDLLEALILLRLTRALRAAAEAGR
jgi:hypothetical protein